MSLADAERPVVVGRITGVFGIKGWVKVASFTDPADNLLEYRPWLIESGDGFAPLEVVEVKRRTGGFVARIEGCDDRTRAEAFAGRDIAVPRSEMPAAEDGEYYWFDLVGLDVTTPAGIALGRVNRLMQTGANDVLVTREDGKERLIPFIASVVTEVDLGAGRITADWDPDF
jgi:16S rRNA processing protein RimM